MGTRCHIRRNDIVIAHKGTPASGGKTGKVLQVFPGRGRVIVEGLNYIHKTLRKSQDNPKGGIIQKEASIAVSNLMLYCPHCKKGVRVARGVSEQGQRSRKCKKCGHLFDG
ncbi:MAG: 50S ribosomal protein L24 [Verrucomicrobia bacterium]|nr:50S ribosomal protein L24 [Verrucomicrobiota bacterium]MCG2679004.1 50S ribosomal protein L24 [Kiritimatiellia bacterium]MBU4248356.1 50S ribosomal protein L24 [Verrucomicrobiota bacterium]MBU4289741.1 50S ribosomal protein L24 [Verrucomicrobiota bacterium]MBU4428545.1 50S ribosomal protein L24 [Verrucomicrobiota bacterium]